VQTSGYGDQSADFTVGRFYGKAFKERMEQIHICSMLTILLLSHMAMDLTTVRFGDSISRPDDARSL
jgi:hypothetical protein